MDTVVLTATLAFIAAYFLYGNCIEKIFVMNVTNMADMKNSVFMFDSFPVD